MSTRFYFTQTHRPRVSFPAPPHCFCGGTAVVFTANGNHSHLIARRPSLPLPHAPPLERRAGSPPNMREAWLARCAASLGIRPQQLEATRQLLAEDATVPFIVRYRSDLTGGMDERQVNAVRAALREHAALEDRRQTVLRALEKADAPPAALQAVRDASDLCTLDDLHAPFKQSRGTLAEAARARGLAPLAERIWSHSSISDAEIRSAFDAGDRVQQGTCGGVIHLLAERVSDCWALMAADWR